jgi:hypothetical protein
MGNGTEIDNMEITIKFILSMLSLILAVVFSVVLIIIIDFYGDVRTDSYMKEVNGMIWGTGKDELRAYVQDLGTHSEQQLLLLTISDVKNRIVFEKELVINWDRWSSGFLKAMQVDDDPEPEIVFYVYRSREFNAGRFNNEINQIFSNFYLDIKSGKVEAKDFRTASSKARELAEIRLTTAKNFSLQLFLFVTMPLIAILIYHLLIRLFWKCYAIVSGVSQE